jgi:nitrogen fixation/metabolism regulation signal transduction histidine kinase
MTEDTLENKSNSLENNETMTLLKRTHSALNIDIAISVYFLAIIFIAGLLAYFYNDRLLTNSIIVFLLIVLLFFFILRLRNSVLLKESIDKWMGNNIKTSMSVRYELAPANGKDNQEKAKNLVFSLYGVSEEYYNKHPESFKTNVTTKSGFSFDLVSFPAKKTIFVKYLENKKRINAEDIDNIQREALSYQEKLKTGEIILISSVPFTEDAIKEAKKCDMKRSKLIFDLVTLEGTDYVVNHVGERKLD